MQNSAFEQFCDFADFVLGRATNFCKVAEISFGRQYYKNLVLTFLLGRGNYICKVAEISFGRQSYKNLVLTFCSGGEITFVRSQKFSLDGNITKILSASPKSARLFSLQLILC